MEDSKIIIQKTQAAIVAVIAAVLLTALTSGLIANNLNNAPANVPTTGSVTTVNVGAYNNSQCTTNCTSINWSTIAPGNSVNVTIYIKNTGTVPVTLSLSNSSWTPTNANTYMTLTWNQEGTRLEAGNSTAAKLTLHVSQSITGITSFSFNIIITGTQTQS